MASKLLEQALAAEPLIGAIREGDKSELENMLDTFDSPADYLAQAQNTTVYAGLSGDNPNQVFEYSAAVNEEL